MSPLPTAGEISAALPVAGADAAGVTNEWASEGGDSDELDPSRYAPRNTRLSAGNTKRAQQFGPVYG